MQDVNTRFAALSEGARNLAAASGAERAERLRRMLAAVLANKTRFYEAAHEELKACDLDVAAQLVMLKSEVDWAAKHVSAWMKPHRVRNSAATFGKKCYILYEPKGVVLNLSTWNAPVCIGLVPAVAAIAAGNSVALKPSELAPHSARVLREVLEVTLPQNEFAVFEGGPEVAQALLALPFNHIYYTGGQRVGRLVMKAAAEHFAGVTLEMGGKNPAIVDASAAIDNAAKKIAWGRIANAGQVCVAPDYVLAHQSVFDATVAALVKAIGAMYNANGAGFDQSPELLRIINDQHFTRVAGLLKDARDKGAEFQCGGELRAADRFVAPVVLTNVTEEMLVMQEEIFAPILPVIPFRERSEAIEIIQRRPKPLALYIFAREREAIDYFLRHTSAGSTVVNHNLIQSGTNPRLPFGGVNHSGMGRIGGEQGFREMSNARSVVEQPLGFLDLTFNLPPYSKTYRNLIERALKA
ncbi:MAG TPA: aldehyde dehydrogenase family protein [Steroidobacteraceae bacterium]|nr:aldehyde dehydrogenase family protein [Steroidobacteraceae bacterium]